MFNICCVDPVSVRYLYDTIQLLGYSLRDNGYDCRTSVGELAHGKYNILLDCYKVSSLESLRGYSFIVYQLEQLSVGCKFLNKTTVKVLKQAASVLDYSSENIEFLKRLKIHATFLPLGYHGKVQSIKSDIKDIDVLFYGSLNRRREALLKKFEQSGIRLQILEGVFGNERDAYIARSKIILNINYYETKIMEIARLSYLLNNKAFILTEEAVVDPYKCLGYCAVPCNALVSTALHLLKFSDEREALRLKIFDRFAHTFPMVAMMRELLAALPCI